MEQEYAVRAFFNESRNRFFEYHPGDRLVPSILNPVSLHVQEMNTPPEHLTRREQLVILAQAAAEIMYHTMNVDSRPNGKYERSLSVADVVSVEFPDGQLVVLACAEVGWKEVESGL